MTSYEVVSTIDGIYTKQSFDGSKRYLYKNKGAIKDLSLPPTSQRFNPTHAFDIYQWLPSSICSNYDKDFELLVCSVAISPLAFHMLDNFSTSSASMEAMNTYYGLMTYYSMQWKC